MFQANDRNSWKALQEGVRTCTTCDTLDGILFVSFVDDFPCLPQPGATRILFISEAPPREGGFWKIPAPGKREDDLREKLLPLLGLSTAGTDRGLAAFVAAGFFLLQSFPRPLKFSIGGARLKDLNEMLEHSVSRAPRADDPAYQATRDHHTWAAGRCRDFHDVSRLRLRGTSCCGRSRERSWPRLC